MRIVEICTANSLGGLELYFASCCKELKDRGNDVLAIVSPNTRLHDILVKQKVDCSPIVGGTFKQFRQLSKAIKSFHPDVVHVHHKRDLLLGTLARKFGSGNFKYVHTRQMDLPRKKKNPYHNFVYSGIDLLIAITERLKGQITERININPEKVISLHYGVPSVKPNLERCSTLALNSSNFNIAVVARIDDKKEQHVIVEAVKYLKDKSIGNINVSLLGGSTDEDYLEKIKSLISEYSLGEQIVLSGFIENPQELMSCFHLLVLTTGNETFGLVLPEAMRMGVAVIGANGGGVPEIIDPNENGLLFEPGNGKDLADKIELMMTDETRKRLAENGKLKADLNFEINSHFEKLEKLFS